MYAKHTICGIYSPFYCKRITELRSLASSARSVNPAGAAAIFGVAWLAGFTGSVSVLLISFALFAGLHLAKVAAAVVETKAAVVPAAPAVQTVAAVNPLAEALTNGLTIKRVEFAQAATMNGRAKKTA